MRKLVVLIGLLLLALGAQGVRPPAFDSADDQEELVVQDGVLSVETSSSSPRRRLAVVPHVSPVPPAPFRAHPPKTPEARVPRVYALASQVLPLLC